MTQENNTATNWPTLKVLHLYPHDMNNNGDYGNLLALLRRMQWRGIDVVRLRHNVGDDAFETPDLIFGGGAELDSPSAIQNDILRYKAQLHEAISAGAAVLVTGGCYQLFGCSITTSDGVDLAGLEIFKAHTVFEGSRLVGNTVAQTLVAAKDFSGADFGEIVGFANHAGKTYLDSDAQPLARVVKGAGNNAAVDLLRGSARAGARARAGRVLDTNQGALLTGKTVGASTDVSTGRTAGANTSTGATPDARADGAAGVFEGVWLKNAIGSYLYGPLLPKNPRIADYLIAKALSHSLNRDVNVLELEALHSVDNVAKQAADIARTR